MIVSEMPRWGHCDGNAGREQLRITAIHWALLPFGWPLGGGNASTIAFFDWEKEKVSGTYQACFVSIERVDYFDTCECEIFCIPSGYGKMVLSGGCGDEAIFHRHSTTLLLQVC